MAAELGTTAAVHQRMDNVEQAVSGFQTWLDRITETVYHLGEDTTNNGAAITALRNNMESVTANALEQINERFEEQKAALITVINAARVEFDSLRTNVQSLYGGTGATFQTVQDRVRVLEQEVESLRNNPATGTSNGGNNRQGFLPLKAQVPKAFGKKESEWRVWQEDLVTYVDTVEAGIAEVLKAAEGSQTEIDAAWLINMSSTRGAGIMAKSRSLY